MPSGLGQGAAPPDTIIRQAVRYGYVDGAMHPGVSAYPGATGPPILVGGIRPHAR